MASPEVTTAADGSGAQLAALGEQREAVRYRGRRCSDLCKSGVDDAAPIATR